MSMPVPPPDTRAAGQSGHISDHNTISDAITGLQTGLTTETGRAQAAEAAITQELTGGTFAAGLTVPPSADTSGATDAANIQAALNLAGAVSLDPAGTYYFGSASPVTVGASQTVRGNWATVVITSALTAARLFYLTGQGASVSELFVNGANTTVTSNPAADVIGISAATSCRVRDIRAQYVNGYVVRAIAGSVTSIADLMISRVTGRNCAAGILLQGVSGTAYLGQVFLEAVQLQQMGVASGPNSGLDALLIEDISDVLGHGINVGMATGSLGRALHISGNCATVILNGIDIAANAVSGGVPALHVDAATGNGSPSAVRLHGSAQGGLYCAEVDAGTDVIIDMRLRGSYSTGLRATGTPTVVFRGQIASSNQGGITAYDLDGSGLTGGGLYAHNVGFETTVGTAAAGVVPNAANVNAQCYFHGCNFRGSGSTPALAFTGTPQQVINCSGYNPRGSVAAPTVGASPYTPATYQTALMVIFTAVNGMTAFAIGGTSVGLPAVGVPYYIGVRQTVTVTWATTAPTWSWFSV